jgi:hypothetical protein
VQIQRGSGEDDGSYKHAETAISPALIKTKVGPPKFATFDKQVMFAQLVSNNVGVARGGEADDLVLVLDRTQKAAMPGFGQFNIKINGHWDDDWIFVTPQHYCNPRWTRFGDFNNDGLDDFLCLEDVCRHSQSHADS